MTPHEAFCEAVRRVGSQVAVAAIVGKRQPAISKRLAAGGQAMPEEVLLLERATGISRHVLRPDIFPEAPCLSASIEADHRNSDLAFQREAQA